MSSLFPHRIIDLAAGFVFIVAPSDDNDSEAVEAAAAVENILNKGWSNAASALTAADVRDPEEADLIYADAVQLLEEAERDEVNEFVITSIIVARDLVIVSCALCGEDLSDEDESDGDDDTIVSEEAFD